MKTILKVMAISFVCCLFASSVSYGQIALATQDFEGATFPPTSWTTGTSNPTYPVIRQNANNWACGYTSTNCALFDSYSIANGGYSWLATPVFSLVGYTSATLNYSLINIGTGGFRIDISTNGGGAYVTLVANVTTATANFELKTADLAAYIGQSNLMIRFYCTSNNGTSFCNNMAYLDNVGVTGTLCTPITGLTVSATPTGVCVGSTSQLQANVQPFPVNDLSTGLAQWTAANTSTAGDNPAHAAWTIHPSNYSYVYTVPIFGFTTTYIMNFGSGDYIMSNEMDQADACLICTPVTNTTLASPAFNTVGLTSLTMTFKHVLLGGDSTWAVNNNEGFIQASTNGTTWTTVQAYKGWTTNNPGNADIYGTLNTAGLINQTLTYTPANASINLNAYVGQPTLYIRFKFSPKGTSAMWTVDNINFAGAPLPTINYNWTPTSSLNNAAIANPVASPTVSTTYTVVATSNTGCTASASVAVASITSAVTPGAITGPNTVCSGNTYTFSITAIPFASAYTWTVPTGWLISSGQGSTTITVIASSTSGNVTVTETNCGFTSAASTLAVVATAVPTVTITPASATICEGSSIQLTASGTSTSYAWSPANGLSAANIANPMASPTITTIYSVIGTLNGCPSPVFTRTVTVNPAPTAVTATSSVTQTCGAVPVDLFSTSAPKTYISPTGDGGFESGTTLAANNWTAVSAASNYWIVGNLAPGYAGLRGTHVSSNGSAYNYTTTAARTSHFYRDVVIPAGVQNIVLSFYWKGSGESGYDRILVYTAPNTVTPVVNVPASTATAITGATLVWTQPTNAQTSYTQATVALPNTLAGTTLRLIFTWQNDNSGGTSPGGAIDNISLTSDPSTSLTYTWTSIPAGYSSSIQNPVGATPTVPTQYIVTTQNSYACTASDTVTVTIDPASVGGTIASNQSICVGTTPADLNLSGNVGTVVRWQQSSDLAFTAPTDIAVTTTTLLGSTIGNLSANTYFRAEVQSGFCPSVFTTPILITVTPPPTSPGPITSNSPQCAGTGVTFTAGTCGSGSICYWVSAATATETSNSATTFTTASVAGTYNVWIRPVIGNCWGTAVTAVGVITPSPVAPTVGTIIQPTCTVGTGSVTLFGLPSPGTWTINPGNINGTGTSTTLNGLTPGTNAFTVTNNTTGCVSAASSVVINPQPSTPPTPVITQNGTTLHSSAVSGNQWYNQAGAIGGATGQNYTFNANGDYYVIVTTSGCSSDTSNIIHVTNYGIATNENNKAITMYPNPVTNELTIEIKGNTTNIHFTIVNAIGQNVFEGNILEKTVVQTGSFSSGVYVIKLEKGETFEFKKIVKE